ncbi:MAG: AAA family ATPase, partial [bacterium]|nr:AAA family ATPase [bacterium]
MKNRKFNYTGACVPCKHYMVNLDKRVAAITDLIDEGAYFSIDRPRQSGKTTILDMLERKLNPEIYLVIALSFEGIGDAVFNSEESFAKIFLTLMEEEITLNDKHTASYLKQSAPEVINLAELSGVISGIVENSGKKVVLTIDEVDKSSNNQLFLSFLGMLRHKYLKRNKGKDWTFQSVILAGVHDVKNLKLKIRPGEEKKYNSPWNITVDFDMDMSFTSHEIAGMLEDYKNEKKISLDTNASAAQLHDLTSGHPFLVSYLCRIIDEIILPGKIKKEWQPRDIEEALQIALMKDNTNSQSLVKNLENNPELYEFVFEIISHGRECPYTPRNPIIEF